MPRRIIPNRLRAHRIDALLTQQELVARAGLSLRVLRDIEGYHYGCRQDTKRRLCKALGVPWAERRRVFP